jgi:hypothetical protein
MQKFSLRSKKSHYFFPALLELFPDKRRWQVPEEGKIIQDSDGKYRLKIGNPRLTLGEEP